MIGFTQPLRYEWTIPSESCISGGCDCVLRIRYNISAGLCTSYKLDEEGDLGANANRPDSNFIDWNANGANSPVTQNPVFTIDGKVMTLVTFR